MTYEGNSDKKKELEKTDIQPIKLKGEIVKHKSSGFETVANAAKTNLKKYKVGERIVHEIFLPTVLEIVNTSLAGMFGIEPSRLKSTINNVTSTVRSSNYWNQANQSSTTVPATRYVSSYDFDNPTFSVKSDCDLTYSELVGLYKRYGKLRVSDIRSLLEQAPLSTDFDYGWENLRIINVTENDGIVREHLEGIDKVQVAEGWMIRMSKPSPVRR